MNHQNFAYPARAASGFGYVNLVCFSREGARQLIRERESRDVTIVCTTRANPRFEDDDAGKKTSRSERVSSAHE